MKSFAYLQAKDFGAAAKAVSDNKKCVAKGAGTDLLDLLKERIVEPDEVVSLLGAERGEKKGELSALATLAEVAEDAWIEVDFPALRHAAAEAATPQVRNVGTVGGNLCQHTRCWYFRNKAFDCFKRAGNSCSAMNDGAHNRYHAIFPHDSCASAHPSNLAPVMVALGAKLSCVHPDGNRTIDAGVFYAAPERNKLGDTILREGEIIRAVELEASPLTRNSTYVEFRERMSFDFAAASVAAAAHVEGGVVKDCRIVCGAVAPTPYRASAAEAALKGKPLDAAGIKAAAEAAVKGAAPLAQNRYKIAIVKSLVREALEGLKS